MKQRIISGIIMLLIIIPIIIKGGLLFTFFASLIAVFALRELINVKSDLELKPFVKGIAYFSLGLFLISKINTDILTYEFDFRIVTTIIIILLLPTVLYKNKYNIEKASYLIASVLIIGISFSLMYSLRNYNVMYLVYIMLISTLSDTYAYVFGRLIGKHKLIPSISPNKTVEGTVFGTIFGTMFAVAFYYMVINNTANLVIVILITTLLSLMGAMGDLIFSAIKRNYDIKDFSNLIPGHGGILDRLDSIIFIILVFSLFINII